MSDIEPSVALIAYLFCGQSLEGGCGTQSLAVGTLLEPFQVVWSLFKLVFVFSEAYFLKKS